MRKITCDFCSKDISNEEVYREYGWYDDTYYDLCEECEDIYSNINHEMSEFRNKKRKELEQQIEKEVKKRIEKLRSKKTKEKENE